MSLPAGLTPEPFIVPVVQNDVNNGNPIAAGVTLPPIPIHMDRDFDFWLCGMAYACPINLSSLAFRLQDAWGTYLSDDFALVSMYAYPAGVNAFAMGAGYAPVFEPPVYCPRASDLQINVMNFAAATSFTWGNLELRGFKTLPAGACK